MLHENEFYIGGSWVTPRESKTLSVINPATEEVVASIATANADDVDRAVRAAKRAFPAYANTSIAERLELFDHVTACYQKRYADLAEIISMEMGAPRTLSRDMQAATGAGHLATMRQILSNHAFEKEMEKTRLLFEPVGVCGFITPWNWPVNQIMCKVAPALAAGCTMVLKPSEIAPLSALLLAEIFDEAGVPAGVFNLVNGDGPEVGAALAAHPLVDMISFTGSKRAGVTVARAAAETVKRVTQELGGKSPYVVLEGADYHAAVTSCVMTCMMNTGQSCNAPTRLLVPAKIRDEVVELARACVTEIVVGDPSDDKTDLGPVVSAAQWNRVQGMIEAGIKEGAKIVVGGTGRPDGFEKGYYVKPTIFADVSNDMKIAREEIFGPVLSIIAYQTEDEAFEIANDTDFGLAAYVSAPDVKQAMAGAKKLRAGTVQLNGAPHDFRAPFGGYKQSGNGREWGVHGLNEFLEVKAVMAPA